MKYSMANITDSGGRGGARVGRGVARGGGDRVVERGRAEVGNNTTRDRMATTTNNMVVGCRSRCVFQGTICNNLTLGCRCRAIRIRSISNRISIRGVAAIYRSSRQYTVRQGRS